LKDFFPQILTPKIKNVLKVRSLYTLEGSPLIRFQINKEPGATSITKRILVVKMTEKISLTLFPNKSPSSASFETTTADP
jgi:hypothetical protein